MSIISSMLRKTASRPACWLHRQWTLTPAENRSCLSGCVFLIQPFVDQGNIRKLVAAADWLILPSIQNGKGRCVENAQIVPDSLKLFIGTVIFLTEPTVGVSVSPTQPCTSLPPVLLPTLLSNFFISSRPCPPSSAHLVFVAPPAQITAALSFTASSWTIIVYKVLVQETLFQLAFNQTCSSYTRPTVRDTLLYPESRLWVTVEHWVGDMIMLTCSAYRGCGNRSRTTDSEDKREHSWGSTDKFIFMLSLSRERWKSTLSFMGINILTAVSGD